MRGVIETIDFGFGLLTPVLLYGVIVIFVTSPVKVVGWAFGYGREIFYDTSEQARFVRVVHIVTTALVLLIAFLLCGCERGPTEADMAGCATHRTPTWSDVIDCNFEKERAARHQGEAK